MARGQVLTKGIRSLIYRTHTKHPSWPARKILKVRRETIRRYIKNGHLKALILPGGDYRLRERDMQRLLSRPAQKGIKDGE
ncbi:hypothetical protein ES703_82059 [subsurface metagenome]